MLDAQSSTRDRGTWPDCTRSTMGNISRARPVIRCLRNTDEVFGEVRFIAVGRNLPEHNGTSNAKRRPSVPSHFQIDI